MLTQRLNRPLAIGAAVVVIGGGAYGIVSATSSSGSAGASTGQTANAGFAAKAGSNARSGPAAGGTVGTVSSVSTSSFTVSTSAGQKVTVKKTSSSAITKGTRVLVLGTVNGTTITATQVVAQPASGGSVTYSPSKVIPFTRGAPTTSKQDGQIPANYSQGSGTIVSGTTANKATTAALAAYPGGMIDRVVKLSNGEYEVHNIGVNWPHHVFVDKTFKVVGAN